MLQLLYTAIFFEMLLILTLVFKTPLRKLVIVTLDRVKRGRGPVVVTTVVATLVVVLSSSLYSMAKIQQRTIEAGIVNPTDQVLMSKHMLEASLMGTFQFPSFDYSKCLLLLPPPPSQTPFFVSNEVFCFEFRLID